METVFPESLWDFALIPDFDTRISELAGMAEQEDWSYRKVTSEHPFPILRNYLAYTYRRLAEEGKISVTPEGRNSCFNSGLVTPNQESIYVLFNENRLDDHHAPWHFWRFCRPGEYDMAKFHKLPEIAHYFDDPSALVFYATKEIRVYVDHIVSENKDRFPEQFRSEDNYVLQTMLKGAIDNAKERVKRNYKTAIPQYYRGKVQLLLPLCLTKPDQADMALVVDNMGEFYRASTCLTLDMAYNNARQLARPDRDWLQP